MKKRILTVISVMGLALMLSSCAYLGYELTEAEQADLGVGPMAASQEVEAEVAAGEAEDQDADEGQAGQGEDADVQDADSQGNEDADGGAGEDANADDQSAGKQDGQKPPCPGFLLPFFPFHGKPPSGHDVLYAFQRAYVVVSILYFCHKPIMSYPANIPIFYQKIKISTGYYTPLGS